MNTDSGELKKQAARTAIDLIESGMIVGLGSGSTMRFALEEIAVRLRDGRIGDIAGVPSSVGTERIARQLGIPLTTLDRHPQPDLNLDGADEVDEKLNLIKGGGAALLREKVLAQASRRTVIMVDGSKLSSRLGEHWPLPVEVLPYAGRSVEQFLQSRGARVSVRQAADGKRLLTDQDNYIFDAHFGPIDDPAALGEILCARAGIIEHGLFVGLTDDLIVSDRSAIRHVTRPSASRS